MTSIVPTDHPLTDSAQNLAKRLCVTRLRMAQGACLCEVSQHLEALVQDACRTLELIDAHPDPEAVLTVDDLGPDADFVTTYLR